MNGHIHGFPPERPVLMMNKLDHDVEISVKKLLSLAKRIHDPDAR